MPGAEADDDCCDCQSINGCDSDDCDCVRQSNWRYRHIKGQARLAGDESKISWIVECNPRCRCQQLTSPCRNRIVQTGPVGADIRLLVINTADKGWGVLTQTPILQGQYVCEYIGEVISDQLAETRPDGFFFNIVTEEVTDGKFELEAPTYDALHVGHLARFINHSCEPNLRPVQVHIESRDAETPHFAFFAVRDIRMGEELSIDYKYEEQHRERMFKGRCKCPPCLKQLADTE